VEIVLVGIVNGCPELLGIEHCLEFFNGWLSLVQRLRWDKVNLHYKVLYIIPELPPPNPHGQIPKSHRRPINHERLSWLKAVNSSRNFLKH
jgi:hypothetical protein